MVRVVALTNHYGSGGSNVLLSDNLLHYIDGDAEAETFANAAEYITVSKNQKPRV